MRPLTDPGRRRLLSISAVMCAAPIVLAPLAAQSSFEIATKQNAITAQLDPKVPTRAKPRGFTLMRDPFVADSSRAPAAADRMPAPGFPAVRAIVTGSVPYALIDVNGVLHVVRPGDSVAGSTIREIDEGGVHLRNGRSIPLTGPHT